MIVETRGAPALPSLPSQITLHAEVTIGVQQATDADPLTFAERAASIVADGSADLVVWIAPVDRGYLVFVAGKASGRALTELVRVDAQIGVAEIERTIALKIATLLDVVATHQRAPVILDTPVPPFQPRHEWRVEVGGLMAYERGQRAIDGRTGLLVGRTWRFGEWVLVPAIGGYWQPSGTIERMTGRASIVELGGIVAAEGGRAGGPVDVFVRPRLVAAGISARGVSRDGRAGDAIVLAPYAGVELGVRRAVANVRFGIVAGCDFALIHRELVIDNVTIVDLGTVRVHVGLSLTVSL